PNVTTNQILPPGPADAGQSITLPDGREVVILGRYRNGGILVRFTNEKQPRIIQPGDYDYAFLPPGVIERATEGGPTPIGDANIEMHHNDVVPILEELGDRLKQDVRKFNGTQMDVGDSFKTLDPADARELNDYLSKQRQNMAQNKLIAEKYAESKRDSALLNYSRRYHYNHYLGMVFPYEFWLTQSMMRWAYHSLDRPMWLAGLHRAQRFLQTQVTKPGMPTRLQGRVKVPLAFLPEWADAPDGVWIDPLQVGLPITRFGYPFEEYAARQGQIEGQTERQLELMATEGVISQSDYALAMQQRTGTTWKRAEQRAIDKDKNLRYDWMDFGLSMLGAHVPLVNAYQFARGTPERIYPLPITRHTRALTALTGVGGPGGVNLEKGIRDKLDIPIYDQWEDYRIDRALSDLVAEGTITLDEGRIAMIQQQGEIYELARTRSAKQAAWGTFASYMFGASGQVYPEGEFKQRINQQLMRAARDAQDKGDTEAFSRFFEAHPEYKARMALYIDNPEDRMRQFLIDKIWNNLRVLPKLHNKQAIEALGEGFQVGFLNKPQEGERDYDAIATETLALWAKSLGEHIPDFEDYRAVEPVPIEYAAPEVAEQYEQYLRLRAQLIGEGEDANDFYERQSEYFTLRDMKIQDPESLAVAALLEDLGDGDFNEVEQAYFDIPAVQDKQSLLRVLFPNRKELWEQYHNIPKNSLVTVSAPPPDALAEDYALYYSEQNSLFPDIGKVYGELYDMQSVKDFYATRDHFYPNYIQDNIKYSELRQSTNDWRETNYPGAGLLEAEYYAIKNAGGSKDDLQQYRDANPMLNEYWDAKYADDSPYSELKKFREDTGLIRAWQFADEWAKKYPERQIFEAQHPELEAHRQWKDDWRNRSPQLMDYLEENPRKRKSERSIFYTQQIKTMEDTLDAFDKNHPEIEEFHEANPHLKEGWDLEREWEEANPELAKAVEEAENAADQYLLDNPDIPQYWDMRTYYKTHYPELLPFITKPQEGEEPAEEGVEGEDFLTNNPALARMFMASIMTGGFNDVTTRALQNEWELSQSSDPFEVWLVDHVEKRGTPLGTELVQ
ncbi:MAG: hypothetical protein QF704_01680, partial [Anaerolineales bacterium]|nr:hypothetical protein [Anaerolineales bacterium]